MSRGPYPEGVTKIIDLTLRVGELKIKGDALAATLKTDENNLRSINEERQEKQRELKELLGSMDVESTGNYGWEARFGWLIAEVIRQSRAPVPETIPGGGDLVRHESTSCGCGAPSCNRCH